MVAAVMTGLAAAQAAQAAPGHRPAIAAVGVAPLPSHPSARSAIRGSTLPELRGAVQVGRPAATRQVSAVVFLRPRNAWLLSKVAARTSARTPYPRSVLYRLFLPPASQVAAVERYLRSQGLTITGRHLLSIVTSGSVAANERAFGVHLGVYRGSDGKLFRAPSGPTTLPTGIASAVQAVGGLDTALRLQTHTSKASAPKTVTATCPGAQNVQSSFPDTMLPSDLASANGYNHDVLINAGDDGNNETIGLVEFSNYKPADVNTGGPFRNCFPAITSANPVPLNVDGGTTDTSGAGEAELDIEVAQAAAPHAAVRVYIAPNDVAHSVDIIDRMITDNITVASDSWGLCEPVLPASLVQAENTHLQLAAAAGMSFYVASGDDGSSGCKRVTGSNALFTDDPSSQPFATSVGGTRLDVSPYSENAWKFGGGGTSFFWRMPAWQLAGLHVNVTNGGAKCGFPGHQCRQSPDVALDANPATGYIVYCTAGTLRCGGATGWFAIGGTSGAAPLMAGITADANEHSLGNAGSRLGFANPFLYDSGSASIFHDITTGSNNIFGGTAYQAGVGFDLATGLGSVDANTLAATLTANGTPSTTAPDSTSLTAVGPLNSKQISYGQAVTFHGVLTDTTTAQPIPNAPVFLQTSLGQIRDVTDSNGVWSITLAKALTRNLLWHAVFVGTDLLDPASGPTRHLYVRPHLSIAVHLPRVSGHYVAHVNQNFTISGVSAPNMHGAILFLQVRVGGSGFQSIFRVRVGAAGKYKIVIRGTRPVTFQTRWLFQGGIRHNWLTAVSPFKTIKIS